MFEPIVKSESAWNLKGRNILISVSKKDKEQEEWWPRITKEKIKNQQITIDWSRWVDPDDEPEEEGKGPGGDFDPAQMQGMGGQGGMPGMGGAGGMPGMGGAGGAGGMDMASMMAAMQGGGGGGMPGMGGPPGAGGAGGMDMASMMAAMGGAGGGGMPGMGGPPGAGGAPGGMDMAKMMEQMKGMGMGAGGPGGGPDSDDEEGEESQVKPHAAGGLDDLDGEENADLMGEKEK